MRTNNRKRWLKILGIVSVLLLVGAGAYAYTVYQSFTQAVDTMQQPIERTKSVKRLEPVTLQKKEPFSVLMLGVDERQGDKGRSDTMVVLTVNPNQNSIRMLSIPRDTRTDIVGHGTIDKINHAYAFGGEEMSMATVEYLLDIPIDYYVRVNMEGFKEVIDAVGSIPVNNDSDFTIDGHHFKAGPIELKGEEALSFVRMRYDDPSGDFGRQERQRQVIQGIIKKGATFRSLTKFNRIFAALGKNVRTNVTFMEMKDIHKSYKETVKSMEQLQLTGEGARIDGIYYLVAPKEQIQTIQQQLKTHLEIPAEKKTGETI